jgi:hypothetical protein
LAGGAQPEKYGSVINLDVLGWMIKKGVELLVDLKKYFFGFAPFATFIFDFFII